MNHAKSGCNIRIILNVLTVLLLLVITICGICSFDTAKSYEVINQYGDVVKMWGAGIYEHDSFFKAPVFIGSDFTMLVVILPLAIITFFRAGKYKSVEYDIRSLGVLAILFYYAVSIGYGVTYNKLHLVYIALFSVCFFNLVFVFLKLYTMSIQEKRRCDVSYTKGMKIFILLTGAALLVAWLPDVLTSLMKGTSLEYIDVYTTEITYVTDMGILSPMMFLTYYLMKNENFMGYVLFRMFCKLCASVGILVIMQTVFQMMAGITFSIPGLITKVMIFVILSVCAFYFEHRLKHAMA